MTFSCPGAERSASLAASAPAFSASVSAREAMAMSAFPAARSMNPVAEPAASISIRVGSLSPGTVPVITQACPSLFFARPTSLTPLLRRKPSASAGASSAPTVLEPCSRSGPEALPTTCAVSFLS